MTTLPFESKTDCCRTAEWAFERGSSATFAIAAMFKDCGTPDDTADRDRSYLPHLRSDRSFQQWEKYFVLERDALRRKPVNCGIQRPLSLTLTWLWLTLNYLVFHSTLPLLHLYPTLSIFHSRLEFSVIPEPHMCAARVQFVNLPPNPNPESSRSTKRSQNHRIKTPVPGSQIYGLLQTFERGLKFEHQASSLSLQPMCKAISI